MRKKKNLNVREDLDFAYLLELMPPLHDIEEYALLPELFSCVGHEGLLKLCKYAGGETIKIPTLEELYHSLRSLQYFYNCYISNRCDVDSIPDEYVEEVSKILNVYYAENNSK